MYFQHLVALFMIVCSVDTIEHSQCIFYKFQRSPFGRRKKRQTSTLLSDRMDENCSEAGQPSTYDPNYLHLCKICSAKRFLPVDRYPNVINEVYCKPPEDGCLGNGNGKCAPTMFNVHILKKRDDICRLCIKDSEALAVNEWEIYIEPISVGCECMLHKNSDFKDSWFSSSSQTNSKLLITQTVVG